MTTAQFFWHAWSWQPTVIGGCLALCILYAVAIRWACLRSRLLTRGLLFLAGDLVILLALVSPLDVLGDQYLFSAHMLQHLLLLSVAPPLLLAGLPPELVDRVLARRGAAALERVLGQPGLAWAAGIGALWIWHLPLLYNAALADEGIHAVEHLCFLASATVLWWPVLAPAERRRLKPLPSVIYLFLAMAGTAFLGILITFVPPGWYPVYVHPDDTLGILPLIRRGWGLSPASDQQLAGLLMWVPGGLVYLAGVLVVLGQWFGEHEGTGEAESLAALNGQVR